MCDTFRWANLTHYRNTTVTTYDHIIHLSSHIHSRKIKIKFYVHESPAISLSSYAFLLLYSLWEERGYVIVTNGIFIHSIFISKNTDYLLIFIRNGWEYYANSHALTATADIVWSWWWKEYRGILCAQDTHHAMHTIKYYFHLPLINHCFQLSMTKKNGLEEEGLQIA